jgi:hypothetical protein
MEKPFGLQKKVQEEGITTTLLLEQSYCNIQGNKLCLYVVFYLKTLWERNSFG